jgi:hypothetical protein
MGFNDVDQLLALQMSTDPRDTLRLDVHDAGLESVLDQLNLMPGHRVRMQQFFMNEARNAARAAHERELELANAHARDVAAIEKGREEELRLLRMRLAELEEDLEQIPPPVVGEGRMHGPSAASFLRAESSPQRQRTQPHSPSHHSPTPSPSSPHSHSPPRSAADVGGGSKSPPAWMAALDASDEPSFLDRWADVVADHVAVGEQRWVSRTFDAWHRHVFPPHDTLHMERFVRRLKNAKLSRGWAAWLGAWQSGRRARNSMKSAAARMQMPGVAKAFGRWAATSATLVANRRKMVQVNEY